jgi:hypothetical protein
MSDHEFGGKFPFFLLLLLLSLLLLLLSLLLMYDGLACHALALLPHLSRPISQVATRRHAAATR